MSSIFGQNIRVSIFGQSHSEKIGVTIDGLAAGKALDLEALGAFLARRSAQGKPGTTARKEKDTFSIVSGLFDGKTCGAPLCALIDNTDTRSADYEAMRFIPRPSHADFCAEIKHGGAQDYRGGGHFSARLTAPLVFAGGVCKQFLSEQGIFIGARIKSIGTVSDAPLDPVTVDRALLERIAASPFPALSGAEQMQACILDAQQQGDSVGGVIECFVLGLPVGVGEPLFDSLESVLSHALFSVPAVKAVAFGDGFDLATMRGSEANDAFYYDGDKVRCRTNRNGGILGGLSTGMPLVFTVAMKPTPSISLPQESVNLNTGEQATLSVRGRHDPCVVARAVPCIESAAALALADLML